MFWLFGARRLRQLGILGMNRRNAACILDRNPRHRYPLVDDKLRMRDLCLRIGVPTPDIYGAVSAPNMLRHLGEMLASRADFVIKPAHGSAGRGILVIVAREGDCFLRHNGERLRLDHIRQHVSDTISGMYSLGGRPDQALVQQRVLLHPTFQRISYKGIPDVRVVVYRGEPAMAMLRLPTMQSNGRANLHQGGIGTGVELETGLTNHAVQSNRMVECHPDTAVPLVGVEVPYWEQILEMACKVAAAVRLGYVGVDIVVDAHQGPMLLEANARPGLAIQIANHKGLMPRLAEIDRLLAERKKTRIQVHRVSVHTDDVPLQKAA
jgi:alpha-L-glutamate ligase-like protein